MLALMGLPPQLGRHRVNNGYSNSGCTECQDGLNSGESKAVEQRKEDYARQQIQKLGTLMQRLAIISS